MIVIIRRVDLVTNKDTDSWLRLSDKDFLYSPPTSLDSLGLAGLARFVRLAKSGLAEFRRRPNRQNGLFGRACNPPDP